jgi:SpoU rRNA methylase family enzyme
VSLRWAVLLLATVSIVGACSEGTSSTGAAPEHDFPARPAWAGVAANGLIVVVEPVGELAHTDIALIDEESLLRNSLGIPADQQLLRLHLGPTAKSGLPDSAGTLTVDEVVFAAMTEMPEGLSPQQRLIWHSVAQGGREMVKDSEELERWSLLVVASDSAALDQVDKMLWQSGSIQVELARQSWSEVERLQFLEASVPLDVEDE